MFEVLEEEKKMINKPILLKIRLSYSQAYAILQQLSEGIQNCDDDNKSRMRKEENERNNN